MANEVEIKFRVTPDTVSRVLGIVQSKSKINHQTQEDQYFETHNKTSLRIRSELVDREKDGIMHLIRLNHVTVKGPTAEKNGVKTREEIEISVFDSNWDKAFELLGFKKSVVVKKYRTSALLHGYEVAIDSVEGLGFFIEIEAKNDFAAASIENMIAYLGLTNETRVKEGYKDLVAALQ